jgi:uncharacterized protein (DUF58 family)
MPDSTHSPVNSTASKTAPTLFDGPFLRRLEALSLVVRQSRAGQWQGERRSLKRGQSVEFADYRNYVPGDDFRLVDWNAYGRLERFFLKLFVEEEEQIVHLLIDTSRSMDWPSAALNPDLNKLTYARRAAAAVGYISLAGLDRVTIAGVNTALSHHFPPHRGRHQAFALFDFLTGLTATGPTQLDQALGQYAAQARQPGPLLIFSDLLDASTGSSAAQPPWASGLNALLARRFEISLIHILSPDEVEPSLTGDLRLLDSETGRPVEITADYEALTRYKAGLAAWQAELREWCTRRSVAYVPVTTDVPFEQFIFTFLRQRGILK